LRGLLLTDKYLLLTGVTAPLTERLVSGIINSLFQLSGSRFSWSERSDWFFLTGSSRKKYLMSGDKVCVIGDVRYTSKYRCDAEVGLNDINEILTKVSNESNRSEIDKLSIEASYYQGGWVAVKTGEGAVTVVRDFPGLLPAYFTRNSNVLAIYSSSDWSNTIENCIESSSSGIIPPGVSKIPRADGKLLKTTDYAIDRKFHHPIVPSSRKSNYNNVIDKKQLLKLISCSVKLICDTIPVDEAVAVLLSGGLDSSIIVSILDRMSRSDYRLFYTGLESSQDLDFARIVADHYEKRLNEVIINENEIVDLLQQVKYLLPVSLRRNPLHVSIAIPSLAAFRAISLAGITKCFAGQGADELFGGYSRYKALFEKAEVDTLSRELIHDILHIGPENVERDRTIANAARVELFLPYLDARVINFATALNLNHLFVNTGQQVLNKYILRQVAKELGLPEIIAERPKKAMQYGSGTMKILKKQAKKNKSNLREWLEQ